MLKPSGLARCLERIKSECHLRAAEIQNEDLIQRRRAAMTA